jgi:hypothetical protein
MTALLKRHPRTTIIWAHTGVGRVVRPVKHHAEVLETMLTDPELSHVMFDISWDEVAKYLVSSPDTLKVASDLFNRHPDRFLFGTDVVAPKSVEHYTRTYHAYDTLWPLLSRDASFNIRKGNYERIFDEARTKVRAWEAGQALTLVQSQ